MNQSQEIEYFHVMFSGDTLKQKLAQVNYTAAISQLVHTFNLHNTLEGKKAWIKVDQQALMHADLTLLSKDIFTFYFMKLRSVNEDLLLKIEELIDQGYEFVLENGVANSLMQKKGIQYLGKFSSIVFDGREGKSYNKIVSVLRTQNVKCTVKNVLTQASYEHYQAEGFTYFLGSYFKEVKVIKGREISASRLKLLDLLRMLKTDAEMDDIITAIKLSPSVSLQLLQYINSANSHTTRQVESIKDATTLLGRRKLTAWITMSLYASSDSQIPPALVDSSIARAHLMELLCDLLNVSPLKDQAFIVGFLSLADSVFKVYLQTILDRGSFSAEIHEALLDGKGDLAKLLRIAKVIESGNIKNLEIISKKINVPAVKFSELLADAYTYVIESKAVFGSES